MDENKVVLELEPGVEAKELVKAAREAGVLKPDKRRLAKGATPEQMRAMREKRMAMIAEGNDKARGGRPKKATKAQAREQALKELEPRAIQVLREQLESEDQKIAQQAARILLEHKWGRPTQRQEVKQDVNIAAIRYETSAITGA